MNMSEMCDFLVSTMPNSNGSGFVSGVEHWRKLDVEQRDFLGFACACCCAARFGSLIDWLEISTDQLIGFGEFHAALRSVTSMDNWEFEQAIHDAQMKAAWETEHPNE